MFKIIFVSLLSLVSFSALGADYAVVAHSSVSASSVDKATLKKIFIGQTQNFGGANVKLAFIGSGSATDSFFSEVVGSSVPVFERTWLEKALSGQGTAPEKKGSAEEVISWVSSTPGGMGFIPAGKSSGVSGSAKVITVK